MTSTMHSTCAEAIVLQSFPFQERDRILSVFSRDEGVLKFIVKEAALNKQKGGLAPLTCAEFLYTHGKSELFKCQEFSILNQFLPLRQSFAVLEAAGDMLRSIVQSQFPHTPAPMLYDLLIWSLHKVPQAKDPHLLAASFRLKLLKHEGILPLPFTADAVQWNQNEAELLNLMVEYRLFADISAKILLPSMREKIKRMFDLLLQ